jgi:transcriptional regulator with XRE-family HTH domain
VGKAELLLLSKARHFAASGEGAHIRERAGLHQTDVARTAQVRPSTISRWESGQRKPHGKGAIRWARLLETLKHWQTAEFADMTHISEPVGAELARLEDSGADELPAA